MLEHEMTLRLTKEQIVKVRALAKRKEMKLGEFIRFLIMKAK